MGNAEPTNNRKQEVPETAIAETTPTPEPANSPMLEAAEVTGAQVVSQETLSPLEVAAVEKPIELKRGKTETWRGREIMTKDGPFYLMDQDGSTRRALLPKEEYDAELEIQREVEKFTGKAWDAMTSLLLETKPDSAEYIALDKYLKQNQQRILEYVALTARLENASELRAGVIVKQEVRRMAKIKQEERGTEKTPGKITTGATIELDYKKVAAGINKFAADYLMREEETEVRTPLEQKAFDERQITGGRARLADVISLVSDKTTPGSPENIENRQDILLHGDDQTVAVLLHSEVREPMHEATAEYSETQLKKERLEAIAALEEDKLGAEEVTQLIVKLLTSFNDLRVARLREAITDRKQLPPEWQRLLRVAKQAKKRATQKMQTPGAAQDEQDKENEAGLNEQAIMDQAEENLIAQQVTAEAQIPKQKPRSGRRRSILNTPAPAVQTEVTPAPAAEAPVSPMRTRTRKPAEPKPTSLMEQFVKTAQYVPPSEMAGTIPEAASEENEKMMSPARREVMADVMKAENEQMAPVVEAEKAPRRVTKMTRAPRVELVPAASTPVPVPERTAPPEAASGDMLISETEKAQVKAPEVLGPPPVPENIKRTVSPRTPEQQPSKQEGHGSPRPRTLKEQLLTINPSESAPATAAATLDVSPDIRAINPSESAPGGAKVETATEKAAETPEKKKTKAKKPAAKPTAAVAAYSGGGGGSSGLSGATKPEQQQKPKPWFWQRWATAIFGGAAKAEENAFPSAH